MDVVDFLPKYPNIRQTDKVLDPYDGAFNNVIFHKNEFYENRLDKVEDFPRERGGLMKHQISIARYLSSHTMYNQLLLVHEMGTGKTCSVVGAIEHIRHEDSSFDGAMIFASGEPLLDNFNNELVFKCTGGEYIPDNYDDLPAQTKITRIHKSTRAYYHTYTFETFAKSIRGLSDEFIRRDYSNKIIVLDEVHNLRIQDIKFQRKDAQKLRIYDQFHRFLHVAQNTKIILLSGTPMKDSPDEIAGVMNLILPLDQQLPTKAAFTEEFLEHQNDGSFLVRDDKVDALKHAFKGRTSFLKVMPSDIEVDFVGEKLGNLTHFTVTPNYMSKFQSKSYRQAFKADTNAGDEENEDDNEDNEVVESVDGKKSGVYSQSRQAALFVFPDGTYGSAGFKKYVNSRIAKVAGKKGISDITPSYSLKKLKGEKSVRDVIFDGAETVEDRIKNLRKYSSKYADIIERLIETRNTSSFVYCKFVRGSGIILLSLILELFGFSKATGGEPENSVGLRYAAITHDTATVKEIKRLISRFNQPDNMNGQIINVIIGSNIISEGFSLSNVQQINIATPHWNYSETAQAIARGIRLGSHNDLVLSGIVPTVKIYQDVSIPTKGESIDLDMYERSQIKDVSIHSIIRIIRESSFDCALNFFRNNASQRDGSRDCDYMNCDYECDDVDPADINGGIPLDDLDYSTYQLYYLKTYVKPIHKKIARMFNENYKITIDQFADKLEDEHSRFAIRMALRDIDEHDDGYHYSEFKQIHKKSPVKRIAEAIEEIFGTHFAADFNTLQFHLIEFTEFEIITALREMINMKTKITNRYGFPSYLKEENNLYFLVDSLLVSGTFYLEYYTRVPVIPDMESFQSIIVPNIVRQIFRDNSELNKLLVNLSPELQETLLEGSLLAQKRGIAKNNATRTKIIEYFKNYVHDVRGVTVSSLMYNNTNTLRCLDGSWVDCDDDVTEEWAESKQDVLKNVRDNRYGIYGMFNPDTIPEKFCINEVDADADAVTDKRKAKMGRQCTSFKINELEAIVENIRSAEREPDYQGVKLEIKKVKPQKKDTCDSLKTWFKRQKLFLMDKNCGIQTKNRGGKVKSKVSRKKVKRGSAKAK
jgi:hypothetical protein